MSTQWQVTRDAFGKKHFEGLRYESIDSVEKRLPSDESSPADTFSKLQILECAALLCINE